MPHLAAGRCSQTEVVMIMCGLLKKYPSETLTKGHNLFMYACSNSGLGAISSFRYLGVQWNMDILEKHEIHKHSRVPGSSECSRLHHYYHYYHHDDNQYHHYYHHDDHYHHFCHHWLVSYLISWLTG